jgi:hypothetical protein
VLITPEEASGLSDGREVGNFKSRYPVSAWAQIVPETIYLFILLAIASIALYQIGYTVTDQPCVACNVKILYLHLTIQRTLLMWLSISLAGVAGGTSFGLKWLYHSVAKGEWNRDRILWRLTVPVLSGVLAVFLGFMIVSGLVPFFNHEAFNGFYVALGYAFFIGYFSDNVLAALKRFAINTFGTVDTGPSHTAPTSQAPHIAHRPPNGE